MFSTHCSNKSKISGSESRENEKWGEKDGKNEGEKVSVGREREKKKRERERGQKGRRARPIRNCVSAPAEQTFC